MHNIGTKYFVHNTTTPCLESENRVGDSRQIPYQVIQNFGSVMGSFCVSYYVLEECFELRRHRRIERFSYFAFCLEECCSFQKAPRWSPVLWVFGFAKTLDDLAIGYGNLDFFQCQHWSQNDPIFLLRYLVAGLSGWLSEMIAVKLAHCNILLPPLQVSTPSCPSSQTFLSKNQRMSWR